MLGEIFAGLGPNDHVEIAELASKRPGPRDDVEPAVGPPEADAEPATGVHLGDGQPRDRSSRTISATRRAASSTTGIDSVM